MKLRTQRSGRSFIRTQFKVWIQSWLNVRTIGSLFVLFHLSAIVIGPNRLSDFGLQADRVFLPYLEFFELTSTWSFFAPNPPSSLIYFEWELLTQDQEQIEVSRYPADIAELKSNWLMKFFQQELDNRRFSVASFMSETELRPEKMLAPYLCQNHAGGERPAFSVRIWRVSERIPNYHEVTSGKRQVWDHDDKDRRLMTQSFCRDFQT